jgi:hypothetical protein
MKKTLVDPEQIRICRLLLALGMDREIAERQAMTLRGHPSFAARGDRLAVFAYRASESRGGDRVREAWVLTSVLGWEERESALALDCSRTALRGHLVTARDRYSSEDATSLKRKVDSFEPSDFEPEPIREKAGLPVILRWMAAVALVLIGLEMARRIIEWT